MSLESLIQNYGYIALFIGSFLEGETIVVLAGFAAHRGYLYLPWVMLCAFTATVLSDQLFFLLGYTRGQRFLSTRPKWQRRARWVKSRLKKHQFWVILSFRFFYGLRNITPFVIGASRFSPLRFLVLNITGAVIWVVTVTTGGYVFGEVLATLIDDFKKYELWALAAVIAIGTLAWVYVKYLKKPAPDVPAEELEPEHL